MPEKANPILFIHGLWLHATSWDQWQDFFTAAGYQTMAPGWPGDADTVAQTRATADDQADHGLDDITNHYAAVMDALPTPPILIGHSFGGMVAESCSVRGAAQLRWRSTLPRSKVCWCCRWRPSGRAFRC